MSKDIWLLGGIVIAMLFVAAATPSLAEKPINFLIEMNRISLNATDINSTGYYDIDTNNSNYLDGYDSEYFCPLNATACGEAAGGEPHFDGNWSYLNSKPNSTFNATYDANMANNSWENLIDFPSACPGGQAISTLAIVPTCTPFQQGTELFNTSAQVIAAVNSTDYYQISVSHPYYINNTFNSTYDAKPSSTFNTTYDALNASGWIQNWNQSGYIKDSNSSGLIKDYNSSGFIKDSNSSGYIKDWNSSTWILNWNASGYIRNQTLFYTNLSNSSLNTFNTTYDAKPDSTFNSTYDANMDTFNTTAEVQAAINGTGYYDITAQQCVVVYNSSYLTTWVPNTTEEMFAAANNNTFVRYSLGNLSNNTLFCAGLACLVNGSLNTFNSTYNALISTNNVSNNTLFCAGLACLANASLNTYNASYNAQLGHNTTAEVQAAMNNTNTRFNITLQYKNDSKLYFGTQGQYCIYYNSTLMALVSTNVC